MNRDTAILAAILTAVVNRYLPGGEMPYRANDLVAWIEDPLDQTLEEMGSEEATEDLIAKIGIGSRFREART